MATTKNKHNQGTTKKNTDSSRDSMILSHLPLVRYISKRMAKRLPSHLEVDDLFEAGVVGLIDAIDKYDPLKKVQFKTYAEYRIRGAILDSLRSLDWAPRSLRFKAARIEKAANTISQGKGSRATDHQISEMLDMPLTTYHRYCAENDMLTSISLESCCWENVMGDTRQLIDIVPDTKQQNPASELDTSIVRRYIAEEIEKLPKKARTILYLYYEKEYTMKKIGDMLDITESRVSQIHSKSLNILRRRLKTILN